MDESVYIDAIRKSEEKQGEENLKKDMEELKNFKEETAKQTSATEDTSIIMLLDSLHFDIACLSHKNKKLEDELANLKKEMAEQTAIPKPSETSLNSLLSCPHCGSYIQSEEDDFYLAVLSTGAVVLFCKHCDHNMSCITGINSNKLEGV